ncbi:MAG TPA: hypothetical protein VFR10_03060 [bacterium]|nr:hypothetical protein [bacterium]
MNEMYVVPHHLIYTTGPAPNNPLALASDYPGQGPTGPNACGTCYPSDREVRSFYFGTESFPICPGVPFEADGCKAELLWILDGIFDYPGGPVSIESQSWGKIKSLYR